MLLPREDTERMRVAVEQNLVQAVETHQGECIAVDSEGWQYSHKWRKGEARVYVEGDDGPGVTYVFAVRVVLVAVE